MYKAPVKKSQSWLQNARINYLQSILQTVCCHGTVMKRTRPVDISIHAVSPEFMAAQSYGSHDEAPYRTSPFTRPVVVAMLFEELIVEITRSI